MRKEDSTRSSNRFIVRGVAMRMNGLTLYLVPCNALSPSLLPIATLSRVVFPW